MIARDKLSVVQAQQIVDKPGLADYYDAAVAASGKPHQTVNFLLGELSRLSNETGTPAGASGVTPPVLAELIELSDAGTINSKTAKDLIARYWPDVARALPLPKGLVEAEGLGQVSDAGAIDALVADILAANAKTAADFLAGKTKVMGFLVGQVMKQSRGKANPQLAEERLRAALGEAPNGVSGGNG
jgi:aspartyl-tRNA(Asn)/glutamyl-tRNA(Gln) amidotransferase subunit B